MSPQTAPTLTVERMRWWDLEAVLAIESELFGDQAWTAPQFWAELARVPESRWYLVARSEDRIVGYAGLFVVAGQADVQTVAVAREAQGRGLGRTLMQALATAARDRGAGVLQLEVAADNAVALSLYRGLGFVADGRRRDYYGRGRDAVLMSMRLGAAAAGSEAGDG